MNFKQSLPKSADNKTLTSILLPFAEVFYKASDPVLIVNIDSQINYVNPAWEKLTGYTFEEVRGKNPQMLNSGKTPEEVYDKLWVTLKKGKPFTTDAIIDRRKDGSEYQIYSTFYPIRYGNKNLFYVQKQHDITSKAKLEYDLKLQSIILKNMNEGVCLVRASDLKIVYTNPKFERMFGYKRGELYNIPIPSITYGSREVVKRKAESIIAKLEKYGRTTFEIQNMKKNGSPFWCRVTATVFSHAEFGKVWIAVNENITKEKNYQNKLEESEKSLKQFLKQASDGIFIADTEGKFTYVNTYGSRMLGFTRREIIGKTILDFIPQEDVGRLWKDREILMKGKTVVSEWNFKRKDGSFMQAEVSAKILPDGRWLAIDRDISGRKDIENKLKESERKYRALFENASEGIIIYNMDRKIIDVNPKLCELFGFRKDEIINKYTRDFIVSEDTQLNEKVANAMRAGQSIITEREVKRKDGVIIAVEASTSPIGDGMVQTIIRDVTERKKESEAIRALNKRISSILNSISDGFFAIDKEWRFEYFNKTAEKMQPSPRKDLLGKTIWEVYPSIVGTNYEKQYRKAMKTQKPVSFKITNSMPEYTFKVHCYPTSFGLSVYFTDISVEEEVVKRQNEFISIASHELRTPLTSVFANIQVLQKYYSNTVDKTAIKIIKSLSTETEKILKLTTDILDTSTIQTGQMKLQKKENNMNHIIREAIKNCQSLAQDKRFVIKGKLHHAVSVDKGRILQVITNLLTNAIKYSPKSGKIVVKAEEDTKNIIISVKDFGVGIPKEKQEIIFNRFYRTAEGEQTASGLGLGLFISYNIIKSHNGKMWVRSELNKGSTFHFSIPK